MRLRTRRFFFYSLVAVFIVVGVLLALAANGLVINLKNWQIERTGAIFLRYSPQSAQVYLNGALQNVSPGFLSSGVFLSNLVPGDYSIRLTRSGFADWTKNLTVTPGLVAAASEIELWPNIWPAAPVSSSSVSDFWPTGDGYLTRNASGAVKFDGRTLRSGTVVLSGRNQTGIVTRSGSDYFFTDLGAPKATSTDLTALFDSLRREDLGFTGTVPIDQVLYHPFNSNRFIIVSAKAVYSLDVRQPSLTLMLATPGITAAAASDNQIFALDASGTLSIFNLLLQTTQTVPLGLKDVLSMSADPGGSRVFFVQAGGMLTEYGVSTGATSTLAQGVGGYWLSPGNDRIAVETADGKLEIVALKNYWNDLKVVSGETWSVSFPGGELQDFAWLPDFPNYGITLAQGTLAVTELDPRRPQNSSVIATGVSKFSVAGSVVTFIDKDGTLESLDLGNL
ncbi:hypothetical protein M1432_00950 [Patescibacteria group bacterium]|nr:hypothetical protein [Patescibacteria group bacterium]